MVFAQEKIITKLGDFKTIKLYSGLTINLKKSDVSKIEISGPKANQIIVKNKNGTLKISLKITNTFKYNDVNIVLYYSDNITTLDANEGSYIISNDIIEQQNLELKVQEGAHIDAILNVKYLTIKTISGGIIKVTGTNQNQTITANTGGIYNGFDLKSTQTNANSSSGAIINVQVVELLNANVNLGGAIYYKGKPEQIITKKVVGGKIEHKN
jgi:hypothetical protein